MRPCMRHTPQTCRVHSTRHCVVYAAARVLQLGHYEWLCALTVARAQSCRCRLTSPAPNAPRAWSAEHGRGEKAAEQVSGGARPHSACVASVRVQCGATQMTAWMYSESPTRILT